MQLKDYILEKIDQKLIYSIYLNIPITKIIANIANPNDKIQNPLRNDINPSLSFKYYGNKLIARDFGDSRYRGDIFEIVGFVLNKDSRNAEDFIDICTDIIDRCTYKNKIIKTKKQIENSFINKESLEISYIKRRFNTLDYAVFKTYGIESDYVDKYINSVESYYLNEWKTPYKYRGTDPCYAYDVNPGKTKFYFPFRNKKDIKFITNNKCPIECLHHLRYVDYIILIKAYKDMILFNQYLDKHGISNILVIPFASETIHLTNDLYSLLVKYSSTKKIYSLLDIDEVGLKSMKYLKDDFNIEPIYFSQGYATKDPTDMFKKHKHKIFDERFINIIKQIQNNEL